MNIDTSKKMTNADMNAAIRAAVAEPRAERNRRFTDRHEAGIVDRLRRAYLGSDPGATAEAFERDLPGIREAVRRRAAVDAAGSRGT